MNVREQIARLETSWPAEFRDGFKCGLGIKVEGPREPGNYPIRFHGWPLARRNAWFAGANRGLVERAEREKGGKL